MAGTGNVRGDFGALRRAFRCLSGIYSASGKVEIGRQGVRLSGIPLSHRMEISTLWREHPEIVRSLVSGAGQRSSVQGRREVVLAVLARPDRLQRFEVCALLVAGRGTVEDAITVSGSEPDWRNKLGSFTDWSSVEGIVAAAEGNNQRAMIGMILQLAGIGRGRLEMIEADVPEEIDEAAQSVRGADWLKAGLPRFETAAGEALWYLMRIRSVHARMVRTRKQGYYTSMALAAMHGSGVGLDVVAGAVSMGIEKVDMLTPRGGAPADLDLSVLGAGFAECLVLTEPRMAHCAARVWKGAAIYVRILDWRIRVGAAARRQLAEGEDIISIAERLKVSRRDLVRILSVRQVDALAERERFVAGILDPETVRLVVGS